MIVAFFRCLFGMNHLRRADVWGICKSFVAIHSLKETGDGLGILSRIMEPSITQFVFDSIWPECWRRNWSKAKLLHELDRRFHLLLK